MLLFIRLTSQVDRRFCDILNQGGYDNPISYHQTVISIWENSLAVSNNGSDQDAFFSISIQRGILG